MAHPLDPVIFAGGLIAFAGLLLLGMELMYRWFDRQDMAWGTPARFGAPHAEAQRNGLSNQKQLIDWLTRHRNRSILTLVVGIAVVVVGAALKSN